MVLYQRLFTTMLSRFKRKENGKRQNNMIDFGFREQDVEKMVGQVKITVLSSASSSRLDIKTVCQPS